MTTVDFHFDPLCPFAYQTSVWIRDVRAQLGITINWRFFSLEEINLVAGKKHPWERDWSYGWSLMRIGALLRRTNMSLLDRWYAAIGHELHTLGGKPHDPAVARRLLCDVGVNAAILDAALDDPTTHDDVRADHQRVVAAGGYGVPTLHRFRAAGPAGGSTSTGPKRHCPSKKSVVTGMAGLPHVYELQRPKSPADVELIAQQLRPYLDGRDWVSINRGEIVDIDRLAGRS